MPPRFQDPFLAELNDFVSNLRMNNTELEQLINEGGHNHMSDQKKRDIIKKEVCDAFGITDKEIMSATQRPSITIPRQVAMAAIYYCTRWSMEKTANHFYQKHSSVHHARKVILDMHDTDKEFRTVIGGIMGRLTAQGIEGFDKIFKHNTDNETQSKPSFYRPARRAKHTDET